MSPPSASRCPKSISRAFSDRGSRTADRDCGSPLRGIVVTAACLVDLRRTLMTTVVTVLMLALASATVDPQEKPRIPDDSVELTVTGCLKGRILTTIPPREAD